MKEIPKGLYIIDIEETERLTMDTDKLSEFEYFLDLLAGRTSVRLTLDDVEITKDKAMYKIEGGKYFQIILKTDCTIEIHFEVLEEDTHKGVYIKQGNTLYGLIGTEYFKVNNELEFEFTDDIPTVIKMLL